MGLISYKLGQTSIVLRVLIQDSSSTTGAGLTGLTSASTGLKIGTIANNEASSTAYTVAGSTIETISTLGTYAAPTATKCRFKEVDATNHPGVYEIQIADARFAVASAKSILVSITGATNAVPCHAIIPLTSTDPYDAVRGGMTALPNAAAGADGGVLINGLNSSTAGIRFLVTEPNYAAITIEADASQPALKLIGGVDSATAFEAYLQPAGIQTLTYIDANVARIAGQAVTATETVDFDNVASILGKFTGITLLAKWLQALSRSSTADATAISEINSGGGTFDATTDSLQAQADAGGGGSGDATASNQQVIIDLLQGKSRS